MWCFHDFIGEPADNLTLLVKWELSIDGKAMDVVGSSQGSQPLQEMLDIVEADVDVVVGTANNWTRLDAVDLVPGTDLTPGWDIESGASTDHCLLADELRQPNLNPPRVKVELAFPSQSMENRPRVRHLAINSHRQKRYMSIQSELIEGCMFV
ncbi:hypothetical protein R1flu_013207 [Riccia fluitans]|uniref:Uncharacterized protein n=1 Tax=Riccia fluitans TaxID=41844 RepID=A0ABD1YCX2_9MARC